MDRRHREQLRWSWSQAPFRIGLDAASRRWDSSAIFELGGAGTNSFWRALLCSSNQRESRGTRSGLQRATPTTPDAVSRRMALARRPAKVFDATAGSRIALTPMASNLRQARPAIRTGETRGRRACAALWTECGFGAILIRLLAKFEGLVRNSQDHARSIAHTVFFFTDK